MWGYCAVVDLEIGQIDLCFALAWLMPRCDIRPRSVLNSRPHLQTNIFNKLILTCGTNGFIGGVGYDTRKNAYVDMVECGIIDPAKVERCAVENAVANAAQFITGHASVTDYVEPKD